MRQLHFTVVALLEQFNTAEQDTIEKEKPTNVFFNCTGKFDSPVLYFDYIITVSQEMKRKQIKQHYA